MTRFIIRLSEANVVCSISNCNTMAFTSISDLHDINGKWWAHHVYVVDLNIPYQPYKYDFEILFHVVNID